MTATGLRYHVQRQDGKEVHRARMVAIEDKYGTVQWRCVECPFCTGLDDLASTFVEAPPQSRW